MAFKGVVRVGNEVMATLRLDEPASGPAFLLVAYGRSVSSPCESGAVVAPGGFVSLPMATDARGRLRIIVDMQNETDTGRLEVIEGGELKDAEAITGDTSWVYAVVVEGGEAG